MDVQLRDGRCSKNENSGKEKVWIARKTNLSNASSLSYH